jgi:hypothetical protein
MTLGRCIIPFGHDAHASVASSVKAGTELGGVVSGAWKLGLGCHAAIAWLRQHLPAARCVLGLVRHKPSSWLGRHRPVACAVTGAGLVTAHWLGQPRPYGLRHQGPVPPSPTVVDG